MKIYNLTKGVININSIWENTASRPNFGSLDRDSKTDVLIIGGGITGILCAYMLELAGVNYILAEADKICSGITKNTTAKITIQHGLIYDELIKKYGDKTAHLYLEAQLSALNKLFSICNTIECDFEKMDSFVYSKKGKEKIEKETFALNKLGIEAEFVKDIPLPFLIDGAVRIKNQAQFNPLKFAFAISKNLNIFENTKVLELKGTKAITNHGRITAKKIICATHFPFINKHGGFFIKLYQHRSYVLALENAQNVKGMYVDESIKGLSFRNYGNILLIGGGGHRTGKQGGGWRELENFARTYYPNSKEVCRFATQDCMSIDNIPYIGQYSKSTPDMYVATGFNKWGMSSAMVSAIILTDMILGRHNPYESVFYPSRNIFHPQLAINTAEAFIGLLSPTLPRCPHMGCALKYNAEEHSWDCSCHGSRFTTNGKLIDNPACDDKKAERSILRNFPRNKKM